MHKESWYGGCMWKTPFHKSSHPYQDTRKTGHILEWRWPPLRGGRISNNKDNLLKHMQSKQTFEKLLLFLIILQGTLETWIILFVHFSKFDLRPMHCF